ncbi:hypothetical protein GH714_006778 [Hevea brasiliensis]|uniref:Uncharacterized protein n=1 Tax=Hevea brasiliensis TaxID=3981 RepID=A0A6A6LCZ2_HEVBR|nr:hypothetical protein GH714_006778 [Hevea brasiliensis]
MLINRFSDLIILSKVVCLVCDFQITAIFVMSFYYKWIFFMFKTAFKFYVKNMTKDIQLILESLMTSTLLEVQNLLRRMEENKIRNVQLHAVVPERNDNNSRISSSPSKSSSTCSSPSSHQAVNTSSARKSMEDVWKDINLTCLQECPASHTNHHPAFPAGVILQDFLVRPFNKDPPTHSSGSRVTDFLDSLAPRPATTLRLNSGSDLENLGSNSVPRRPKTSVA